MWRALLLKYCRFLGTADIDRIFWGCEYLHIWSTHRWLSRMSLVNLLLNAQTGLKTRRSKKTQGMSHLINPYWIITLTIKQASHRHLLYVLFGLQIRLSVLKLLMYSYSNNLCGSCFFNVMKFIYSRKFGQFSGNISYCAWMEPSLSQLL